MYLLQICICPQGFHHFQAVLRQTGPSDAHGLTHEFAFPHSFSLIQRKAIFLFLFPHHQFIKNMWGNAKSDAEAVALDQINWLIVV